MVGTGRSRRPGDRQRSGRLTILIALMVLCGLTQACSYLPPALPTLLFAQGEARCATAEDVDRADVALQGDRIEIGGTIRTSTPCHHLVPRLTASEGSLTLSIETVLQPGPCPTCIGAIDYSAAIVDLEAGTYMLEIKHAGQIVEQIGLTVSL